MSISATPGTTPVTVPDLGTGAVTSMSADSLLAYCQSQLGGLDDEIGTQMQSQQLKLKEREAIESVQKVVDSFGTDGPQNADQWAQIGAAVQNAVQSLGPTDPASQELLAFQDKLTSQYGYQPPHALTADESAKIGADQLALSAMKNIDVMGLVDSTISQAQTDITNLQNAPVKGTPGRTPDKDNQEWKGTSESLATDVQDMKDDAELGLLSLQDLVSQRQQAVQLCTNMMSKVDDGLEEQAKAIGR
jgi:hypothetical protein